MWKIRSIVRIVITMTGRSVNIKRLIPLRHERIVAPTIHQNVLKVRAKSKQVTSGWRTIAKPAIKQATN